MTEEHLKPLNLIIVTGRILACLLITASVCFGLNVYYPKPIGLVNDFAHAIDNVSAQKMIDTAVHLKKTTGVQLAVVTIKTHQPVSKEEYAVSLFKKWGIGQKEYDNGVLVLFSKEDRDIKIETGYGLEDILPDGFCGRILDEYAVPAFKEGAFGKGLLGVSEAISQKVTKDYKPVPVKEKKKRDKWLLVGALVVFAVALLGLSLAGEKGRKFVTGAVLGAVLGYIFAGLIGIIAGAIIGVIFSYRGLGTGFYGGGFGGFGGNLGGGFGDGGGFGGFGGGGSGGGGAGRSW